MNKLTMFDYVKETPGVLRTNIEQYTTLVDPLMKEVQQKEIKRILLVASGSSYNACYSSAAFAPGTLPMNHNLKTPRGEFKERFSDRLDNFLDELGI